MENNFIKEALVSMNTQSSIELLKLHETIKIYMRLSLDELSSIWKKNRLNKIYSILCNYINSEFIEWEDTMVELSEVKGFDEYFKLQDFDVLKKLEKGVSSTRPFKYRCFFGNWIVTTLLLEYKYDLDSFLTTKMSNNVEQYGYQLSTIKTSKRLKNYIKENDDDEIEDDNPFVYYNWKWSYNKYLQKSVILMKGKKDCSDTYMQLKIDLKNAFPSTKINYKEFENKIIKALVFLNTYSGNQYNTNSSLNYGDLTEPYIIANYCYQLYFDKLHRFLKENLSNNFVLNKSMCVYVDDANVFVKNDLVKNEVDKKKAEDEIKGVLEKWNKHIIKEDFLAKMPAINSDKVFLYNDWGKMLDDSSASKAEGSVELMSNLSNEEIKNNIYLSEREKDKVYARKVANKILTSFFLPGFIMEDDEFKVVTGKYGKNILKIIISESQDPVPPIHFLYKTLMEKSDKQGLNSIWTSRYLANILISVIRGLKDNRKKSRLTSLYLSIMNKDILILNRDRDKGVISDIEMVPYDNKDYTLNSIDDFLKKLIYISKSHNYKMRSSEITEEYIDSIFQTWSDNCTKTYDQLIMMDSSELLSSNEAENKFYLSGARGKILSFLMFDEDNYIYKLLIRSSYSIKNRRQLFASIRIIADYVIDSMLHNDEVVSKKPEVFYDADSNFDEMWTEIYSMLSNQNKSRKASEDKKIFSNFNPIRQMIHIMSIRQFLYVSWYYGTRELEHYSEHNHRHSDKMVKNLSKIMTPSKAVNYSESFTLILSIYIHDLSMIIGFTDKGLLYDETTPYATLRHDASENVRVNHGIKSFVLYSIMSGLELEFITSVLDRHWITEYGEKAKEKYNGIIISTFNEYKFLKINCRVFPLLKLHDLIYVSKAGLISMFHSSKEFGKISFAKNLKDEEIIKLRIMLSTVDLMEIGKNRLMKYENNINLADCHPVTYLYLLVDLSVEKVELTALPSTEETVKNELLFKIYANNSIIDSFIKQTKIKTPKKELIEFLYKSQRNHLNNGNGIPINFEEEIINYSESKFINIVNNYDDGWLAEEIDSHIKSELSKK